MPNYRYRPNYRKPKDSNSWWIYIFMFFIFGGGGILAGLLPLAILALIGYVIYMAASNNTRSTKYKSAYDSSKIRSYRNNYFTSNYTTYRPDNTMQMEKINRKLAFYFENNTKLNVINDISLRLKSDAYVNLNSLNVYIKDQYVCSFDDFKNKYPDIYDQIINWITIFDEEKVVSPVIDAEVKETISATKPFASKAEEFIEKINDLNTEIPDEGISEGLYESSALLKQISDIESKFPTNSEKLDKLYEYYLPMLIKNLSQYKSLQAAQTNASFEETKLKLQKNVTLINEAMKTITASLCEEDFINLSADISTLESLLKKDGLAGDNRMSTFKGGVNSDE